METAQIVKRVATSINIATERPDAQRGEQRTVPVVNNGNGAASSRITGILDGIITTSITALFFGLPLFFVGLTFQGVAFEKQLYFYFWLLIALVAWAAKGVIRGEMHIRRTPLDYPFLAFLAAYLLATIFSVDRWHSFWGFFGDPSRGLIGIVAIVIGFYLIVTHTTEKRLRIFLGGLFCAAGILSVWVTLGIMGVRFLPDALAQYVPLSPIGSLSGLTVFVSVLLPLLMMGIFALWQSADAPRRAARMIATGALSLVLLLHLFLLLALSSFVPWGGTLAGVSFFLIYILARIVRPTAYFTWIPMAVFVIMLMILMVGENQITRITLPVEVFPNYALSWNIAQETMRHEFFLGSGPATFGHDFSLYRPQEFNLNQFFDLRFYQGTGLFFEFLPTIGIIGTVTFVLALVTFIGVAVYLLSRDRERNKIYSLGLLAASLTMIVDLMIARTDGVILILGIFLLALTLVVPVWESGTQERVIALSLKASPKFALTLAFIFMIISAGVAFLFVFVGKVFVADLSAGAALRAQTVAEDGSVQKMSRAIALYGSEGRYYTRLGQEYMVLVNTEALKKESDRNVGAIQRYLNNSIAAARRGSELMSSDVLATEVLGQIYENAGLYVADSRTLAEQSYRRALELEPHNPKFLVKIGQVRLSAAATSEEAQRVPIIEEAKKLFEEAIAQKQNFSPAHYQLALTREALGDLDGALESMNAAALLEQNNVTYVFNLGRLYQARGKDDDNTIAEALFKRILGVNDKEVNTHFSLGLLYEKTNRIGDAIAEYRKVMELLPEESGEARERVQTMITNIESGISNLTAPQPSSAPQSEPAPQEAAAQPDTLSAPATPTEPQP